MSKKKLATDYSLRLSVALVARIVGFLVVPILIKQLGLVGYGRYCLAMSVVVAYASVASLRLPMAMIRFYPDDRRRAGGVVGVGLAYWCLIALASAVALASASGPLAAKVFDAPYMDRLLVVTVAAGLAAVLYEFICSTLRAESRFGLTSLADASERVGFLVVCVALAATDRLSVRMALGLVLLGTLVKTLFVARPALRGVEMRRPEPGLVRRMFGLSLPFLPHLAGLWAMERGCFFFVLHALGDKAVGVFGVAFTLAALLEGVVLPIQNVLYPMVRRAFDAGRHAEVKELLTAAVRFALFVAAGATLSLCIGTPHVFSLLTIGTAAPPVLPLLIMCLAFTVRALCQVTTNLIHISRRTGQLMWISPLAAGASILFYTLTLGKLDITGAALGLLAGGLVRLVCMAALFPRTVLPAPPVRFLIALGLSVAGAGVIQWSCGLLGAWPYVAGLVLSGAVYFVVIITCGGVTDSEKASLRALAGRWLRGRTRNGAS